MKLTLRALRVNYGLTQTQLGHLLNVSKFAIESYESGRTLPNARITRRIINLFDIDINSILFCSHMSLKGRLAKENK